MSKNEEVVGNAVLSQAMFERQVMQLGKRLLELDHHAHRMHGEGRRIKALRLKGPAMEFGEWMAVLTAEQEGVGYVAFHSGETASGTLAGLIARLANSSLKWKEDEYAKQNRAEG